jgi:hypothetical protein
MRLRNKSIKIFYLLNTVGGYNVEIRENVSAPRQLIRLYAVLQGKCESRIGRRRRLPAWPRELVRIARRLRV